MNAPASPRPVNNSELIEVLTRSLRTAADKSQWQEAGGISALLAALEDESGQPAMANQLRVQAELFFMRAAVEPNKDAAKQRAH